MGAKMIDLKSGKNDEGKIEFYLVGMDTYESFDQVVSEMQKIGPSLLDTLDGIYSRTALFEIGGRQFKIIFHEDVGIYAFSLGKSNNDDWLQKTLADVVANLNQ